MMKLFKYELKITYRRYFVLFLLYLLMCSLISSIIKISSKHIDLLISLSTLSMIVTLNYVIFKNFKQILLTTDRYLTSTLTYSNNQFLLTQLILSFVWTGLGLGVCYFGIQMISTIASTKQMMFHIPSNIQSVSQFIKMSFMTGLSLIIIILTIYCICVWTYSSCIKKYRWFFSTMISVFAFILILSLFTDSHIGILSTLSQNFYISFVIYFTISCILYFTLYYLLSYKMNIIY